MSKEARHLIQDLAKDLEDEDNRAFDLWTWLPSHKVATKYHGDYACNFTPSVASILEEAAFILAEHAGYEHTPAERAEFLQCPCGEGCEQERPKDDENEDDEKSE